jgi:hypothetical protein
MEGIPRGNAGPLGRRMCGWGGGMARPRPAPPRVRRACLRIASYPAGDRYRWSRLASCHSAVPPRRDRRQRSPCVPEHDGFIVSGLETSVGGRHAASGQRPALQAPSRHGRPRLRPANICGRRQGCCVVVPAHRRGGSALIYSAAGRADSVDGREARDRGVQPAQRPNSVANPTRCANGETDPSARTRAPGGCLMARVGVNS